MNFTIFQVLIQLVFPKKPGHSYKSRSPIFVHATNQGATSDCPENVNVFIE